MEKEILRMQIRLFRRACEKCKYALSNMIDTIMCVNEVKDGISWQDLEEKLTALDTPYMSVVELAFDQLRMDKPYEITRGFIIDLGNAFLFGKTARIMNGEV